MIDSRSFLGYPVVFKQGIEIYPPLVQDAVNPESKYSLYKKILTMTQEEIEDEIVGDPDNYLKLTGDEYFPTPLERILSIAYNSPRGREMVREAFKFFLHQEVDFLYDLKKIIVGGSVSDIVQSISSFDEIVCIDGEEEFFIFQNTLRLCIGESPAEKPQANLDPRIRRIKAKTRYREKIKAKKGLGISFDSSLVALCLMNVGVTPFNVGRLTLCGVKHLITGYQKKEKFERDMASCLAGADAKKINPQYWITSLEKDDE